MSLRLYIGCMFSGKTSELLREYNRWQKINKKVICINSILDDRYDNVNNDTQYTYTHNLHKMECIKTDRLMNISKNIINSHDVVLINEGQFFTDIVEFCKKYVDGHGKNIVVCALDGDFQRKPFDNISELYPLADDIMKLKALCTDCVDGTPAIFSWRLEDIGTHEKTDEKIVIGNNYVPLCRQHYNKRHNKTHNTTEICIDPEDHINYII